MTYRTFFFFATSGNGGMFAALRKTCAAPFLVFMFVCGLLITDASALTATGSPSNCTNDNSIGSVSWTTPTLAYASDDTYAQAIVDGTTSMYLYCTGYGFAIPAGATIQGITVNVERHSDRTQNGGSNDAAVRLIKGGIIGATDKATATTYTLVDVIEAHGSAADLWGTTWTDADVNAANFGVAFAATKPNSAGQAHVISVDHIQVVVTYSLAAPATCNSGTVTACSGSVINTYYPGVTATAGSNSITVGTSPSGCAGLSSNDLILVMQMQDAAINSSNTSTYGTASSINAGKYEYAKVSSYNSSTGVITLSANLVNTYTNAAATGSAGQKAFQVIRVPVYSGATLGAGLTALPWNGSVGGVFALDVVGALALGGQTLSVNGLGFRGGAGFTQTGASGTDAYGTDVTLNTNYRTGAAKTTNAAKGEGIGGTPRYVWSGSARVDTTVEGYPNGSNAMGAPANAGGGGTDLHPSANDENTGGGGGGNGGAGGTGGEGWCNGGSAPCDGLNPGGVGGRAVTGISKSLVAMGGGGGAGSTNNGTGSPGGGNASSGVAGGGLIIIRAGSLTGTGTLTANGASANGTVLNDGSGGAGAGGAVVVQAASGLGGLTIQANGGTGGSNTPGSGVVRHGPGGGGGGGIVVLYGGTGATTSVAGGASGTSINGVMPPNTTPVPPGGQWINLNCNSTAYCATAGAAGQTLTSQTWDATATGLALGAGPCMSSVDHFAITTSGNGVTCQPETVTITAHDSSHGLVTLNNTTTISLSATVGPGNGGAAAKGNWSAPSGLAGTFTAGAADGGTATYAFPAAGATSVTLLYQNTWGQTANFNANAGGITERTGTASADSPYDPDQTWSLAGFRFVDGSNAAIGAQTAGVTSGTYYLQPVIASCTTYGSACAGICADTTKNGPFTNGTTVNIGMAYACTDPATCSCTSAPATCAASSLPTLTMTNNASSYYAQGNSGSASSYISVPLLFSTAPAALCSGGAPCTAAPFTFSFTDVGKITLNASYTVAPGGGGTGTSPPATPMPMVGASAPFLVKPYGFTVTNIKRTSDSLVNPGASDATGSAFMAAGDSFTATVTAVAYCATSPCITTPNFGLGTNNGTEAVSLATNLVAPLPGNGGTLSGTGATTTMYRSAFTNGVKTVTDLSWSEVGIMTLTASNSTFEGTTLSPAASGTSGNIGRFIPSHFGFAGAVQTRSDVAAGSSFTYMDEPMKLTITVTAYNTNDVKTQNYVSDPTPAKNFAKLDATTLGTTANWFNTGCTGTTQCMGLGAVQSATGLSNRLGVDTTVAYGSSSPTSSWVAGVGTFTLNTIFGRAGGGAVDGPYDTLMLGGMPRDSDGVTLPGPASADTHKVNLDATIGNTLASNPDGTNERRQFSSTTSVRYGRLRLLNAYGSELLPIRVPIRAEYCAASSGGLCTNWVTNANDSLTPLSAGNIAIGNCQGGVVSQCSGSPTPGGTPNAGTVTSSLTSPLTSGLTTLTLTRPGCPAGTCPTGSFDLALDLGTSTTDASCNGTPHPSSAAGNQPWLRYAWCGGTNDPSARIKFGASKAPYIYLRERY